MKLRSLPVVLLIAMIITLPPLIISDLRAQSPAQRGVTLNVATAVTDCTPPTKGLAIFCPVTGQGLLLSMDGSAFFVMGTGATGPQGPVGPQGIPGQTGPQGPAGTLPSNCPTAVLSGSSGLTFGSNCK